MEKEYVKGGEFLIADSTTAEMFTPEDFTDEHRMIGETCREYIDNEVVPQLARSRRPRMGSRPRSAQKGRRSRPARCQHSRGIRRHGTRPDFGRRHRRDGRPRQRFWLDVRCADLDRPASDPVLGLAKNSKNEWIPKIISGEAVSAYCLTESSSGSDALGAKCVAKLSEDGQTWTLNGEKMWITNGGFADVYIVFAKVDGEKEKFSAFVVPRSENCRPGDEEHKLGIKSSSTTAVILSDAKFRSATSSAMSATVQRSLSTCSMSAVSNSVLRSRAVQNSLFTRPFVTPMSVISSTNRSRRLVRSSTSSPRWRSAHGLPNRSLTAPSA